ncbi:MAG: Uma2 family endonuclease [Myxococcaceae bacterium]|nr:Uma2 family endonuclease [Myxococcaceae bacterium]MCI0668833.1 Uma2 family endonuclease [Myxococcaceae bacterium]
MAIPRSQTPASEGNPPEVEAAFQAVPEEMVSEIVEGELHVSPRPARPHTTAASNLGGLLFGPFKLGKDGPGGWVILDEPELHLGPRPDKIVPDLAGWRRERMADAVGGDDAPAFYDLAPDWACEVLSERTRRFDRVKKMRTYAREGVRHVWLVEPVAQTLEVFRLEGGQWVLAGVYEGDEKVRAEPFEAIELDLAQVWAG